MNIYYVIGIVVGFEDRVKNLVSKNFIFWKLYFSRDSYLINKLNR